MLPRPEYLRPGWARRPQRAVHGGAAAAARPVSVFCLLSNGGRWGGQRGRGLRLVVQGLEERVQLLFQDRALHEKRMEGDGVPPRPDGLPPRCPGTNLLGHDLRLLRALSCLLIGLPHSRHEVLHCLTEHSAGANTETLLDTSARNPAPCVVDPGSPKATGTHFADEITTECWSEVRILERWAATESS